MDVYWGSDCIQISPELLHWLLWLIMPGHLSVCFALPERHPMTLWGRGQHKRITYAVGPKITCFRYQTFKPLTQLQETDPHSLTKLLNVCTPYKDSFIRARWIGSELDNLLDIASINGTLHSWPKLQLLPPAYLCTIYIFLLGSLLPAFWPPLAFLRLIFVVTWCTRGQG